MTPMIITARWMDMVLETAEELAIPLAWDGVSFQLLEGGALLVRVPKACAEVVSASAKEFGERLNGALGTYYLVYYDFQV